MDRPLRHPSLGMPTAAAFETDIDTTPLHGSIKLPPSTSGFPTAGVRSGGLQMTVRNIVDTASQCDRVSADFVIDVRGEVQELR